MADEIKLPDGLTVEKIQGIYTSCKNSIEYFAKFFFPHIVNRPVAKNHPEVYKDLKMEDNPFYACAEPRGHGKSTKGTIIKPMHYALFDAIGDVTLLSASEDFILNEIVRPIKREFEHNEKLRLFFGDLKTPKWSESYFVLKNGIAFEAGGIGGQLRGGRRGLIVLDDLESNESVESEEQREKLRNRINKELIPKLLPGGQMIYLGTLISPLCYLKHILDNEKGWKRRHYDCYHDGVEAEGHELWKEMLPHAELQRRKTVMGSFAFQSEYRNQPIMEATAAIKENMIRNWETLPQQYSLVMAIDPAYSEDKRADFKTCSLIASDANGNRYLVSYIMTHAPSGEFIDAILNMYLNNKNTIISIGCPKGSGDTEFWTSLNRKAEERKLNPPFVELKNTFVTPSGDPKKSKKARAIAALQPLFESGKYYIHPTHIEAREQLLLLNPNVDQEHDDLVDSMAYAEQLIQPVYFDMGSVDLNEEPVMAGRSANYGMDD